MAGDPLPRHRAQHVYLGEQRYYQLPDGVLYPGVTTILGSTKDAEDLDAWKDRNGGEAVSWDGDDLVVVTPFDERVKVQLKKLGGRWWFDKSRKAWCTRQDLEDAARGIVLDLFGATRDLASFRSEKARDRGTGMHGRIECFLQGLEQPCDELALAAEPYFQSLLHFLPTIRNVRLLEGAVWHPDGWAGSIDCIAEIRWPGTDTWVLAIVDWKTADREKLFRYIEDYRLQVAAYAAAANRVYQLLGVRIAHGVVVIAIPGRAPQLFYLNGAMLKTELQAFRERVYQF